MRDREKERERERQRHRQREKQAPCRELNVGLNPGSPGSHPGLKAALNSWATLAARGYISRYFISLFFLKDFIYLFMRGRERERERGRDTGRGRSRLHAGSLMWDSIPGLQDHVLG